VTVLSQFLAYVTAVTHALFVVALVGGAFVVCLRPGLWKVHLPVVIAMATVALLGADCPLTVLENTFRELGGWPAHDSGFISHYFVEPLNPEGITPTIQAGIIAAWIAPNALAYSLALRSGLLGHHSTSGQAVGFRR
jgi:hypothetical protein